MTVEALSSNAVNYLVWRYLQEAGYENTAIQLCREWIRDPDSLPFAKGIGPHTLINILQDGLWFDKLQAEAGLGDPRYHFGANHGRPYAVHHEEPLPLDEGAPTHGAPEEANGAVQEPVPRKMMGKRKRGVKGVNGVAESRIEPQTNGDPMDVDVNGNTHTTESLRAESETVVSEPESPSVEDIPISTLSIGQSTKIQTEIVLDLIDTTTFVAPWKNDKGSPHSWGAVDHTIWGPSKLFVVAGKSLLRVLHIPDPIPSENDRPNIHSKEATLPFNSYKVTAICWNSGLELTVAAQTTTNEDGEVMTKDILFKLVDAGKEIRILSAFGSMFTTLRWNEVEKLVLGIASNDVAGSIRIWKDDEDDPAWTFTTDVPVMDAAWINPKSFVVCGGGYLQIFDIEETLQPRQNFETTAAWEMVRVDQQSGIIACGATGDDENPQSFLGIVHPRDPTKLETLEYPEPFLSDLAFQPRLVPEGAVSDAPVLLATGSTSGTARLYDAREPFQCLHVLIPDVESQIDKVGFSSDGTLLATGGRDVVIVRNLEKPEPPLGIWNSKTEPNEWDSSIDGEFNLGWDREDARLSIALGNQLAIINIPR